MLDGLPDDLVSLPTSPWDERPTELPLDVEEVRTALWLTRGNVKEAAETLKITSQRLRRFVKESPYLQREMDEAKEVLKDIAEANVYEALTDAQDPGRKDSMTRFVLSSIGKDRGYGAGNGALPELKGPKGRITISWDDGTDISGNDAKVINGEANP